MSTSAHFLPRHRLFVLTDIENEPDDTQSLTRLLLYSNDIDIEGIVAVTSTWLRKKVHPESILDVIDGYAAVHHRLVKRDDRFPHPDSLKAKVGSHLPLFGLEGIGEGKDSFGSDHLIEMIDRADEGDRPLHVALWGGANCLAQALWKVQHERTASATTTFVAKIRVYAISDQDDTGPWIRRTFPLLHYVVSVHAENAYLCAAWTGFASQDHNGLPGAHGDLISADWLGQHIQVGPLGSKYPNVKYGMEGDTPSFLALIPNGLSDPERPDFGGWGGRYGRILDPGANHYHDSADLVTSTVDGSRQISSAATIWRWRDHIQHDFAARMQWTLRDDEKCIQRPPIVIIDDDKTQGFVFRDANCLEMLEFDASNSTCPDQGTLTFKWFQYKEIEATLPGDAEVPNFEFHGTETSPRLKVTMPATTALAAGDRIIDEAGKRYHIILQVTSSAGAFPLTRYRRVIISVRGKGQPAWLMAGSVL